LRHLEKRLGLGLKKSRSRLEAKIEGLGLGENLGRSRLGLERKCPVYIIGVDILDCMFYNADTDASVVRPLHTYAKLTM